MRKAIMKRLDSERLILINAGICQYTNSGRYKIIDDFINNWSCLSDDEEDLIPTKIGVFGDSHAVDKVAMLRMNQLDVMQLGGEGCPLLPSKNTKCNKLLLLFHDAANEHSIDTVLIANRFQGAELDASYLEKVFNYWGSKYNKVVVFSPMVEFPDWEKIFLRSGLYKSHPDFDSHNKFFELIDNIPIRNNISIVDTRNLFCGDVNSCSMIDNDGEPLLIDYGHLSTLGARKLGEKFLVQQPLQ